MLRDRDSRPRSSRSVVLSLITVVVGTLVASGVLAPNPAAAATKPIVTGWLPYWTTSASLTSYTANADLFSNVSPFWHDTTEGATPGTVRIIDHNIGTTKASAMATLRASGKKIVPSITDGTATRGWMASVLADPGTRSAHVQQLLDLVVRNGYDGIDLDYEKFAFSDGQASWATTRPAWVAFVAELSARFHAQGLLVTAAVPTSGYWVYDFAAIGQHLDSVRVMTYDYSWGTPGPVAPIWWVEQETTKMLGMIPAAKLMMGVPAYGRDWARKNADGSFVITDAANRPTTLAACPSTVSTATRAPDANKTAGIIATPGAIVTRDASADEVKVLYNQSYSGEGKFCTVHREAWLADAATVVNRARMIVGKGAAGIALWTVGGEDPGQWAPLRALAQSVAPPFVPAGGTVRIRTGSPNSTVMGNLTVTDAQGPGYLTAWPCNEARPTTSVSNYVAGQTVPAFTAVRTDAQGEFCVYTQSGANVIWDQTATTALASAQRRVDTRAFGAPMLGGSTLRISTGVPNTTLVGNLTVVGPTAAGFITLFPCAMGRLGTSNENYVAGQVVSNFAAVRTDGNGDICAFTSANTHLLWDQQRGVPITDTAVAVRTVDTRISGVPLAAGGTLRIPTGKPNTTVLGNATVVNPAASGELVVWRCGDPRPTNPFSTFAAGAVNTAFTSATTDANGEICVFSSTSTHVLWDDLGDSAGMVAHAAQQLFNQEVPGGTVVRVPTGVPGGTVSGHLTVTGPSAGGYTAIFPCDETQPGTSVNNFGPGATSVNFATTRADATGDACIFSSAPARITWDQVSETRATQAHIAQRLLDTRATGKVAANAVVRVRTGAPNTTVMGSLTVTEPVADGYTTVWPCADPKPNASVNNFLAGQTTPNFTVVRTDANGEFCASPSKSAHLIWDEAGESVGFDAVVPQRLVDTRAMGARLPAGAVLRVRTGAPRSTVLGNLTVTEPVAPGYTTAWPCDQPRPTASTNNYVLGLTTPNFVAVRTDSQGDFCVFTTQSAHLVFDRSAATTTIGSHAPARLVDTRPA